MHAMKGAALAIVLFAGTAAAAPALKDAYRGTFLVGVALNQAEISGRDAKSDAVVISQFNAISPENVLKWETVHPTPDRYDFSVADRYVAFGEAHHLYTIGHVLVWQNQTPDWVFAGAQGVPLTREVLLKRLHDHIATVVGRYRGRIKAWDVVNEAVDDDGRMRETPWSKIIGADYVETAFRYAREADPDAELIYNDYNIEYPGKRAGALALVERLKAEGVPITTVGIQCHYLLAEPDLKLLDDTIAEFGRLGVKVAITELDIDVLPRPNSGVGADAKLRLAADPAHNPYVNGLPDGVAQAQAARYAQIFAIARKHNDVVDRVTVWGVTDADSWHNGWPIPGRTAYSLLFDRAGNPKPAVAAILKVAQ